ncbi:MAG: hypothetical protein Q8O00_01945, partial [Holophaga sp.]|nr:hypothetical protein [Holophaga sp.]
MTFAGLLNGGMQPRRLLGKPEAQDLSAARLPWILGAMALWALAILLRLVWLQIFSHERYQQRAQHQHITRAPVPAIRGEVRDRRGIS